MNNLTVLENGLIPVMEDGENNKLVDGRELHSFVESKQEFTAWMKNRLEECGAIENEDFTTFDNFIKREESNLGTKRTVCKFKFISHSRAVD